MGRGLTSVMAGMSPLPEGQVDLSEQHGRGLSISSHVIPSSSHRNAQIQPSEKKAFPKGQLPHDSTDRRHPKKSDPEKESIMVVAGVGGSGSGGVIV